MKHGGLITGSRLEENAGHVEPRTPGPAVVTWAHARELAHRGPHRLAATTVPVSAAAGLTLAQDVHTLGPLPAFDTAAMDGFAVCGNSPWQVVGQVTAGSVWPEPLHPGTCVRISTGAQVPERASSVVPVEAATLDGAVVSAPVQAAGRHIRCAGEDAAAGTVLAPTGTRIGPAMIGLIATCGYDSVRVRPAPRVRVLITGDELHRVGTSGGGSTRDALGPMLPALLAELGGVLTDVVDVSDRRGALAVALKAACADQETDVVVVTGSTSVGVTDALRPTLRAWGAEFVVDRVACRPGRPQLLARVGTRWVAGLPGNPFAALVAAHTVVGPLVAGMAGRTLRPLPHVPVDGCLPPFDRDETRLIPVAWQGGHATIVGGFRAAFLRGAALADGFAALPPDWTDGRPAPVVITG